MSSPGTIRFAQLNVKPSAPPAGYDIIYVKTDNVIYIQDSSGTELAIGSATPITALTGDVTAIGPGNAVATVVAIQGNSVSNVAPTNTQILIWNAGTSKWTPYTVSGDLSLTNIGVASITATTNSTFTSLTGLTTAPSLVVSGSQVSGGISGTASNITASSNSTLTTLPSLSLPVSQLSGTVAIANGGTALSTTPTNGQLLIGNGTNYTLSTLTASTGISIANSSGSITVSSSGQTAITTKTANYTILTSDSTIFCDTTGGAFTLTLPDPSTIAGKIYRVIDTGGVFQTNNLTLARHASEKIEGLAASKILSTNWGWFNITTNSTDWFVG